MRSSIIETATRSPVAVCEAEAARLLGIGESTLQRLRKDGKGPKHKQIGERIVYGIKALEAWVNT